jgi:Glycosyl transferase family group 2
VKPDFIASIVGYFDDPAMGFVQTPQAYREWEGYPYLRMCNWEYSLYLVSTLVSRNERMAAITLGTMGLIRRKLLDDIGGWAEWCVTEDSELALRIHAHGYKSTYVNTAFGQGLIPESFGGYKRQRFRWCYGAIQELRRHFHLLLPKPFAAVSRLSAAQKLSHLMHALDTLKSGLEFLMLLFGAILMAVMLLHGATIPVPSYLWPILAAAAALAFALKFYIFRTLGWSLTDTLGAAAAHAALDHTIAMAGFAGLLTRTTHWRRTDKFRAAPTEWKALGTVMPELVLGTSLMITGFGLLAAGHAGGLLVLLLVGGLLKGAKYLLAPLLVVLAEYGIQERADGALPLLQTAP